MTAQAWIRPRGSAWWHRVASTEFAGAAYAVFLGVSGIQGFNAVHGKIGTECGRDVETNGCEHQQRRPTRGRFCRRCAS